VKLQVVLEPSEEGGFTASVPSLPGCISEGDTREDALRNIREAIELYLEPVDDDLSGKDGAELAGSLSEDPFARLPSNLRGGGGRGALDHPTNRSYSACDPIQNHSMPSSTATPRAQCRLPTRTDQKRPISLR